MSKKSTYEVRKLLYVWISKLGRRNLNSIKEQCDYLSEHFSLSLSNPIWEIFWPLVYSGVIDHTGNGYYALTEPLILEFKNHFYYINFQPKDIKIEEVSVGIYLSNKKSEDTEVKTIMVSPYNILKHYPSIDRIIDKFPETIQDVQELKFDNWKSKKGLAELEKEGLKRFFVIPEQFYKREVPDRTVNPDAFALTYRYSRVVNGEDNGAYYKGDKRLFMPLFAMPIMLYRVLQLETMASRNLPDKTDNYYVFENIPSNVVKEINRILCNSIRYE